MKNQSRNFKTFIANKIGEIQNSTNPEQWRHVPGELNPADLATRGIKVSELAQSRVWKEGPQFVLENETSWPTRIPGMDTKKIVKWYEQVSPKYWTLTN